MARSGGAGGFYPQGRRQVAEKGQPVLKTRWEVAAEGRGRLGCLKWTRGYPYIAKELGLGDLGGFSDPPIAIRWLRSEWGLVGCEEEVGLK